MLPLLLALLSSAAAEPPKTLHKAIDSCPSVGYFFERQNPGPCYLCYCNNDGDAVCTLRDNERCDNNDSSADVEIKLERNHRRSRRGLMDLFFDDAKKDVMMKSMVQANDEDCKPKSSKSIGCPPKDWCTGCLVCDCDDNGEWQCHVMSFCEDKTPRPKAKKIGGKKKKTVMSEVDMNLNEIDGKKDNQAKTNPTKKNDKRSVKPTKKDTKITKKKSKKKSTTTTTTTTTSSTTKKPSGPQIAVKTLKKFIRKDQMKNGTGAPGILVIKKYISTISPIESPELLKYKNDSQKLAQILYQQYEASSKTSLATKKRDTRAIKREFKLEKKLNNKQKKHFELKYNARGRKPMNTKEHNDWNIKMRARKTKHENLKTVPNANNFYWKQNELMNPDEKEFVKSMQKDENTYDKASRKMKTKVILIPRKRRNKRNVQLLTEVPTLSTIMESEKVNTPLVERNPEGILKKGFEVNKDNTSDVNNYEYTVNNTVTKKFDDDITNSDIVYESTIKYVDVVNNEKYELETEHATATNVTNYKNKEVDTTTQPVNYDLQSLELKDYTVNEIFTQDSQLELKNNNSLETTTSIDYTYGRTPPNETELTTTIIEKDQIISNTDKNPGNNTIMTENINKKVYITDIDTIITGLNKYNLKIWKKYNKTRGSIASIFTVRPNNSLNRTRTSSTTDIEKMFKSFSSNKTKNSSKHNRMIAIKYLKKLYTELLSTKNNKSRLNNVAVMESICDTFGPCKISRRKIEVLNFKITGLIAETKKALDIIRTIKNGLQLIDGETNSTERHNDEEVEFKSYVKKLNAVLTDNYITPLKETQITQMNHVKNNTKAFINSIGKFAFILNDILEIIHAEKIKYDNLRKRKILIKRVNRRKVNEPLHKIKNLFLRFNLLQNTFMRNMYHAISDLELQNEQNAGVNDKGMKHQRDTRYETSVNKYMNKINYNLEKLKDLALKMGTKQRKKRNAMDHDDAVRYLLTLMEYLLKQNNPVDSPPVADGIDLLINAIRRAPDIKPIKRKVHKHMFGMPPFPDVRSKSKSSSESEDDNLKNQSELKDNFSIEESYSNDTQIMDSSKDDFAGYKVTTPKLPQKSLEETITTTKYVDVEDLVFNGNVIPKVYMATIPAYENTDNEKEDAKTITPITSDLKTNESVSDAEDETNILPNSTVIETNDKTENITETEKPIMTQFDRLNEEYENQIKGKAPSIMNLKLKRKKTKRLRQKPKVDNKSDVSTITKEIDEEKTRKKVIAEEAVLRKHIMTSTDDDPFNLEEESSSRDLSLLDAINNEVFPSYFT